MREWYYLLKDPCTGVYKIKRDFHPPSIGWGFVVVSRHATKAAAEKKLGSEIAAEVEKDMRVK